MPFDKFAREDLWALSSLRAFLFDEYRIKKTIASIKIRVYRLYRLEPPYLGEIGIIELAPISSGASPSIPVPVSELRLSGQWSSFVSQVFLCTYAHYQFLQKY